MVDCDSSRQDEEIQALSAIYEGDFLMINPNEKIFEICINHEKGCSLNLKVLMPMNYPSSCPPMFELHGQWLQDCDDDELRNKLHEIYCENAGECVVFQWVQALRSFLDEKPSLQIESEVINSDEKINDSETVEESITCINNHEINPFDIIHGEPITDRRSTFQAHLVKVESEEDVKNALIELKKIRKISNATHNMYAYCILKGKSQINIHDCDDDGETHAGSRLLHLLRILNVQNYLIVVSRWYGGIQLGPDRFKHINNCARKLLKSTGVIVDKSHKELSSPKNNKEKTKRAENIKTIW